MRTKSYKSRKKISSRHVIFFISYLCHKGYVFNVSVNIKWKYSLKGKVSRLHVRTNEIEQECPQYHWFQILTFMLTSLKVNFRMLLLRVLVPWSDPLFCSVHGLLPLLLLLLPLPLLLWSPMEEITIRRRWLHQLTLLTYQMYDDNLFKFFIWSWYLIFVFFKKIMIMQFLRFFS